jgi:hypothetical protein
MILNEKSSISCMSIRTLILEDLCFLEARKGKLSQSVNQLISQSPRGLIIERLRAVLARDE